MTIKNITKYKSNETNYFTRTIICLLLMFVPLSLYATELGMSSTEAASLKTTVIFILIGALGWIIQMYISDKKRSEKDQAEVNREYLITLTELKDAFKSVNKELLELKEQLNSFKITCDKRHNK